MPCLCQHALCLTPTPCQPAACWRHCCVASHFWWHTSRAWWRPVLCDALPGPTCLALCPCQHALLSALASMPCSVPLPTCLVLWRPASAHLAAARYLQPARLPPHPLPTLLVLCQPAACWLHCCAASRLWWRTSPPLWLFLSVWCPALSNMPCSVPCPRTPCLPAACWRLCCVASRLWWRTSPPLSHPAAAASSAAPCVSSHAWKVWPCAQTGVQPPR